MAKCELRSTVLFTSSFTKPSAETLKLTVARSSKHAARSGSFRVIVKEITELRCRSRERQREKRRNNGEGAVER